MTPKRLVWCLDAIGWSTRGAADRLNVHETKLRYWKAGRYPVPDEVAAWLETLAAAHRSNPPPKLA